MVSSTVVQRYRIAECVSAGGFSTRSCRVVSILCTHPGILAIISSLHLLPTVTKKRKFSLACNSLGGSKQTHCLGTYLLSLGAKVGGACCAFVFFSSKWGMMVEGIPSVLPVLSFTTRLILEGGCLFFS